MKRASYREAISWIALNDDNGSKDALDVHTAAGYISTALVADLFGLESLKVAKDVCKYRTKESKTELCHCGRTDKHRLTDGCIPF